MTQLSNRELEPIEGSDGKTWFALPDEGLNELIEIYDDMRNRFGFARTPDTLRVYLAFTEQVAEESQPLTASRMPDNVFEVIFQQLLTKL